MFEDFCHKLFISRHKECTMNHKTDTFSNYDIVLEALFPTYKNIFLQIDFGNHFNKI